MPQSRLFDGGVVYAGTGRDEELHRVFFWIVTGRDRGFAIDKQYRARATAEHLNPTQRQ